MNTNNSAQVKSRAGYHYEHTGIIILSLFILLLLGGPFLSKDPFTQKDMEMLVIGGFILIPGFTYILYRILQIPSILITSESISVRTIFKTTIIPWKEVTSINLSGKYSRGFLMNNEEGIALHLKNNKPVVIWITFYSNQYEIRSVLEKINIDLAEGKPITVSTILSNDPEYIPIENEYGEYTRFSGNPLTTWRGIMCLGTIVFFALIPVYNHDKLTPKVLILLAPIIAFYVGFGMCFFHFYLSDQKLVIKNHFFFWYRREYDLKQVREMVVESDSKAPLTLRVIAKGKNDKTFGAASLREKHWNALRQKLNELNIPVRAGVV